MINTLHIMVAISVVLNRKKDSPVAKAWGLGTLKFANAIKNKTKK